MSFEIEYQPWDTPLGKVRETKRITLDRGRNLNGITSTFTLEGNASSLPVAIGCIHRKGKAASEKAKHWFGYWEPRNGKNGHTGVGIVITSMAPEYAQHTQKRVAGVGNKKSNETNAHTLAVVNVRPGEPFTYHVGAGWSKSGNFSRRAAWFKHLSESA